MALTSVAEQNISDRIADELREAIQSGELEPGERLVERKLAERLGVSHIPVREALAKLAEERLIDRQPRRGARVAALSAKELEEIASLRIVLEQFVGQRVQERWNERSNNRLRKIVQSMVDAAERGDGDKMFALDRSFHELLGELADHELLMGMSSQLRGRTNGFLRATNRALESSERIAHAEAHGAIVDALASGDVELMRRTIAEHIEIGSERISGTE